ncbi:hypothetical protein C8J57DRAFT_1511829 [Mycena rebaudengoi]|nr:hypothetical protein C8J57DRAFT_1518992 [Mycena rebaudengoi]KAJ7265267.1 hypothetical protein C8J57DRAFT_1511829 [Mycena rebaudengoi]
MDDWIPKPRAELRCLSIPHSQHLPSGSALQQFLEDFRCIQTSIPTASRLFLLVYWTVVLTSRTASLVRVPLHPHFLMNRAALQLGISLRFPAHGPASVIYMGRLLDGLLGLPRPTDGRAYIYVYVCERGGELLFKIGRTADVQRRMNEWAAQCVGERQLWLLAFSVPYAKQFERILHLHFKRTGAWMGMLFCPYCGRQHMEKFSAARVGGVRGLLDVVAFYLRLLRSANYSFSTHVFLPWVGTHPTGASHSIIAIHQLYFGDFLACFHVLVAHKLHWCVISCKLSIFDMLIVERARKFVDRSEAAVPLAFFPCISLV